MSSCAQPPDWERLLLQDVNVQTVGIFSDDSLREYSFDADSTFVRTFNSAVRNLRDGWEPYLVTEIGRGIFFQNRYYRFQVLDDFLFVFWEDSAIVRKVGPELYRKLLAVLRES